MLSVNQLIAQQSPQTPAPPAPPAAQTAPSFPAQPFRTKWEVRHAGDVTLEAPFAVEDGPDVFAQAPEKLRQTLVSVKTFTAGSPKQGFRFTITTIIYKPGVPVDLDAALKDVTSNMKAAIGNPTQKLTSGAIKISGLDARHAEYHGVSSKGLPIYIALLMVQRGEKLWQVQTLCMNESVVQDLARVMNSVTIEPAP
jgi:hypothetical protein